MRVIRGKRAWCTVRRGCGLLVPERTCAASCQHQDPNVNMYGVWPVPGPRVNARRLAPGHLQAGSQIPPQQPTPCPHPSLGFPLIDLVLLLMPPPHPGALDPCSPVPIMGQAYHLSFDLGSDVGNRKIHWVVTAGELIQLRRTFIGYCNSRKTCPDLS